MIETKILKMSTSLPLLLVCVAVFLSPTASTVYYVVADGGQPCPLNVTCHKLSYYISRPLQYFRNNTDFLFLKGIHQLDEEGPATLKFFYIQNLTFQGEHDFTKNLNKPKVQANHVIHCTHGRGGFSFFHSSVTFETLTISNCGALEGYDTVALFADAAHFFTLHHVSIQHSAGFGFLCKNCKNLQVHHSSFTYSGRNVTLSSGRYMKGINFGLYYTYTEDTNLVTVSDSNFTDGYNPNYPGGGIDLYSRDGKLSIIMNNLLCLRNVADQGGGLDFILTGWSVTTFNISNSRFVEGLGEYSGGGMLVQVDEYAMVAGNVQDIVLENNQNSQLNIWTQTTWHRVSIIVSNVLVLNNRKASSSSDVYIEACAEIHSTNIQLNNITIASSNSGIKINGCRPTRRSSVTVTIQNSVFTRKTCPVAVIVAEMANLHIVNTTFSNNSNGVAVIAASLADPYILTMTDCTIADNAVTGVSVREGLVLFTGQNVIQNNKSNRGAGILLSPLASIAVNGILTLHSNEASDVGGGIMQTYSRHTTKQYSVPCSIDFLTNTSRVIFSNNTAKRGGDDAYGLRLMQCHTKYSHENVTGQEGTEIRTPGMTHSNSLLRHFFFSNVDRLSPMSSDPIMVCFCNSSNMPNCEERSRQYDAIYPGERLVANIATVGYYGGTSAGTVQIQVENASLVGPNGLQGTTVTCRKLTFQLDSPSFTTAHIDLTVIGGLPTQKLRIDVSIKSCPPGFHKIQADSPNCQCDPRLTVLNVSCHINREYCMFQKAGNNWFSYTTKDKCLIMFENCPFDYCKRSLLYFDLVDPEGQCNGNRTGTLCGQCQAGLSLLLGSNRCGHCNNLYLILLIPFILAGIVLVAVLLFLKLTVSVGTINGLLFYANMVKLNELVFFPKGSIPVVSQFIAWLNLDLTVKTKVSQ